MFLRPSFKSLEMASRRALTSNDVSRPATSSTETAPFLRIEIVNVPLCNACPLRRGARLYSDTAEQLRNFFPGWRLGTFLDDRARMSLPNDHAQAAPPTFR